MSDAASGPPALAATGVAVVTDSTACLPPALVRAADVQVVPLQVVVEGRSFREGVDIGPDEVAAALRRHVRVTTSRPSLQAFLGAYTRAADAGARSIVSVHLPAEMSGTCESAQLAARESPVPTEVVDSRTLGMGLGYLALHAASLSASGARLDDVARSCRERGAATTVLFYVATLEHLRRGGRIGAAAAVVGSALSLRPLLVMDDGLIRPLERVRTSSRALARLGELALTRAAERVVDLAVHHLDAAADAGALADRLRAARPGSTVLVSEVGAVVGAHVGPGTVAVVVAPAG